MSKIKCACGRTFTPKQYCYEAIEKFCSTKCQSRYSWYGRHAWLYNKEDLKQKRVKHNLYKPILTLEEYQ